MWLINLILNVAGLLLWLRWREKDVRPLASRSQILLATTLKRTRADHPRLIFLLGLIALLVIRSLLYWQLGEPLNWIPIARFGVIPLAFRSDFFWRIFLFSFYSFGATLGTYYMAILLFSIVNESDETNAFHKMLMTHLGWIGYLPGFVKLLLPWTTATVLWCALNPLLVAARILPKGKLFKDIAIDGAVFGTGVYLVWEYAIVGVLIIYILNSYIYFGTWPFWDFIDRTGRRLMRPLARIPLRIGKIDLKPAVGIAIVLLAGFGVRFWLSPGHREVLPQKPSPMLQRPATAPVRR